MAYRELSVVEFYDVVNYFFAQGIEPDIAGDKVTLLESVAKTDNRPTIDVFSDIKENVAQ